MTGLPQIIEPGPAPLPDHLEIGVRLAAFRIEDARRMQRAAAANHWSVRYFAGIEPDAHGKLIRPGANGQGTWLRATEEHAAEQYAYARYLMGIDDDWLKITPHRVLERNDYKVDRLVNGERKI